MSSSPSARNATDAPRTALHRFDDGTRAEATYFGDSGQALFGMTHLPATPNGQGVLICSPIYNDYLKNNRREVLLARQLALKGFTVQRFNYAGTGNSEGEIAGLDLDSMMRDAGVAHRELANRPGVEAISLMGTRMGAIPAAHVASGVDAPVVLWEPTDGDKYFRELFRTMAIIEMDSDGGGATVAELKQRFQEDRTMDAAGYVVGWPFYESASRGLPETLGDGNSPVFLAQFRDKPELRAEYTKLVGRWEEQGREISTHYVLVDEAWMLFVYGFRPEEERVHTMKLIDATTNWFEGLL